MCIPNSEKAAPIIPIYCCMLCKKRRAQPEIGICRRCERTSYSVEGIFGAALIVAVLGLGSGCAPRVIYRPVSITAESIVTFLVPRRDAFDGSGVQFRRQEEHFANSAAARDFVMSFTEDERRVLDVHESETFRKENCK